MNAIRIDASLSWLAQQRKYGTYSVEITSDADMCELSITDRFLAYLKTLAVFLDQPGHPQADLNATDPGDWRVKSLGGEEVFRAFWTTCEGWVSLQAQMDGQITLRKHVT